jgi:predicted ATP-dependent endonuclease of OLD family
MIEISNDIWNMKVVDIINILHTSNKIALPLSISQVIRQQSIAEPTINEKYVKLLDDLENYELEKNDNLKLQELLEEIFFDNVAIIREDRGLLKLEDRIMDITLDSTVINLFSFKNGPRKATEKYTRLQKEFQEFFPNVIPDIRISEEWLNEKSSKKTPEIVFYSEEQGLTLKLNSCSSGMYEILMLLNALYLNKCNILLLDEPGRSLHPNLKQKLAKLIMKQKDKFILTITHDSDIISETNIEHTLRVHNKENIDKSRHTCILPYLNKESRFFKWLCDPRRLPMFFSPGILFVEGEIEVRFFKAFAACLQSNLINHEELKNHYFRWDIIQLDSCDNTPYALGAMDCWSAIEHVILLDTDTLIRVDGSKGVASKTLKMDIKYKTEEEIYDMYEAIPGDRNKNIHIWPPTVGDIEGVGSMIKKHWKHMFFTDLQELIINHVFKDKVRLPVLMNLLNKLKDRGCIYRYQK